jgi:putative component of toxin-antitoxin plasmid stabilization module
MTRGVRRPRIRRRQRVNPFRDWLTELDKAARARVQARILRFETGNFGDHKDVGAGVLEARLDFVQDTGCTLEGKDASWSCSCWGATNGRKRKTSSARRSSGYGT